MTIETEAIALRARVAELEAALMDYGNVANWYDANPERPQIEWVQPFGWQAAKRALEAPTPATPEVDSILRLAALGLKADNVYKIGSSLGAFNVDTTQIQKDYQNALATLWDEWDNDGLEALSPETRAMLEGFLG